MSAIPVVDLAASDAADQLVAGLAECGFVELTNHGADLGRAAELRAACDEFFALPRQDKAATVHPRPEANRGWRAKGSEALSYSLGEASPPDLFESFNCGHDDRADDSGLIEPTPWPAAVPSLQATAERWLEQMRLLAERLDGLLSVALGVDLAARSAQGPDTMACIDYRPGPDGSEPVVEGQQRMGAHSDYTTFTILLADPVPGLQIVGESGWVDVVPQPGSVLLNVGDLLAMYTNDEWPSTLHRVVPMAAGAAPTRRTVAYFHYPDLDVEVAPLAKFVPAGGQPRYQPVTVRQHLLGKLAAPKVHKPATGASTTAGRNV